MKSTSDTPGNTMCMYKKSSKCHTDSSQGKFSSKEKKINCKSILNTKLLKCFQIGRKMAEMDTELELLGATLNREYYIGKEQVNIDIL